MSFTKMGYHIRLFLFLLLHFLVFSATQEIMTNFTCTLTWRSWVEPDLILVTWEQLPVLSNGSDVTIRWVSDSNTDVCSASTLTSCMCRYGDANTMSFGSYFDLHVTTDEQTFILPIDPVKCQKPVQVTEVLAEPINSTCLDVRWYYEKGAPTLCSDYGERVFQITYASRKNEYHIEQTHTLLDAMQSCNGEITICDLDPFTLYDVQVRCKLTDENGQSIGHWSEPKNASSTTRQSVPTGAPSLVKGGFHYISNNCHRNHRTVRVYFQPVSKHKRNGIITTYHVSFIEQPQNTTKEGRVLTFDLPGKALNVEVDLECMTKYQMVMAAATRMGVAKVLSSTFIPAFNEKVIFTNIVIVPMVTKADTITVSWKLGPSLMEFISDILIIWCLKSLSGECQEYPSWQTSQVHITNLTIKTALFLPPYRYMVGISAGNHGIIWTTCHFSETLVPLRPVGVTLNPQIADRSILITWENSPCESRTFGPYIDHFKIQICPVEPNYNSICSGSIGLYSADHGESSYVVHDLDPDMTYMVWIIAVGLTGSESPSSSIVYASPLSDTGKAMSILVWLIPLCIAAIIIAVLIGSIIGYRKIKQRLTEKSEVKVPDIPLLHCGREVKIEEQNGRQYASC